MPRKLSRVSPLKMRKDLLIAESGLNRSQLVHEWEAATGWHRALSAGARTFGVIASAAALLVSGVRVFRHKPEPQSGSGPSWLQPIVKGAGLVSSFWGSFRSRGCGQKDK